jgi:2-hydroxychromene-2-carboxylate isomerase
MIEVFADVSCPFTYVGLTRILARRDELGRDDPVIVKAWPLELVNGEPLEPALVAAEVVELRRTIASDLFAGFDPARLPVSTLAPLALTAAAYRRDVGTGEQVSIALRRALFEDGIDVSSPDALGAIARDHDIPVESLDPDAVVTEWREGERRGVEGSPHFFLGAAGFFCPALRIAHVDGRLQISKDEEGFAHFIQAAFPA